MKKRMFFLFVALLILTECAVVFAHPPRHRSYQERIVYEETVVIEHKGLPLREALIYSGILLAVLVVVLGIIEVVFGVFEAIGRVIRATTKSPLGFITTFIILWGVCVFVLIETGLAHYLYGLIKG